MEKLPLGKITYDQPVIEKAEIFLRSQDVAKPGAAVEVMAKLFYLDYSTRCVGDPKRQLTVRVDLDNGTLHHRRPIPCFANLTWFLDAVRKFVIGQLA